MKFYINGEKVTGINAELHFINWCLKLENEFNPVAHCSIDASRDFQQGAYRGNIQKRSILKLSGIEIL